MSRLTTSENGTGYCNAPYCQEDCNTCIFFMAIRDKLAHYEELEEQGRLIELPCKVGSVLYRVVGEKICEYTVEDFFVGENGVYMYITHRFDGQNYYGSIHSEQFNRHYYLTKAEAEARLAEMKGGAE